MKKNILLLVLPLIFASFASADQYSKRQIVLTQLKEAQKKNSNNIARLRSDISTSLGRFVEQPLVLKKEKRTRLLLAKTQSAIESMMEELRKRYLQVEFWDRLQFQTERKYKSGSFKAFLEKNLLELAQTEALSTEPHPRLWKTFIQASWSVKNACNSKENPVSCLETQLQESDLFDLAPSNPSLSPQANSVDEKLERAFEKLKKAKASIKTGLLQIKQKTSE